ncbi:glycosyltransferase family 4 protein [Weissella minor]|uniref:glycosyltransferase family 4 protein n=1 Tax=Weissella minor TaxID=1620 RepID=UPI001BB04093|nr:glycosyltransferase family 4 protein [Weissella minor]MBS0950287.1 glycosyltransferase family 4 protein [Weissella minor]
MIKITMFSAAETVPGQGVGSAYRELVNLLEAKFPNEFPLTFNKYSRADISHYHTINPTFFMSTFLPGRGRKIGYVHFLPETLEDSIKLPQPIKSMFYWYVMTFYERMDHIVVVNPTFIDKLVALGVKREKVTYIPNFVSKDTFYPLPDEERSKWRQKIGFTADQYIILGVGQVQERKGVWDFIKLAEQNPQWQFVWTGGFSFGAMTAGYEELKRVVDNPPENLTFTGIVDRSEMNAYYNMADVFLLPSYTELFPMSALEAFSTGTPTVLRDLDLYKAIIEGYYLPATDRDGMQQALEQIEQDADLKTGLSNNALAASERYSADNVAKIWQKFYTEQAEVKK